MVSFVSCLDRTTGDKTMETNFESDFFISHASEDKDEIARPLANALKSMGFKVWYDEFSLKLGDSLNLSLNQGLASSQYGIVILSPSFFSKNWTRQELNGLVALEIASGNSKILPIMHNLTHKQLVQYLPMLADRIYISTSEG